MLRKKGYVFVCDPYRRYATIRSLSAKKCMRTFRLGAEYDKEALQDRLLENQRDIRVTRRYFEFMRPYTREYARKNPPTEEYYRQRDFYLHLPRVNGYLSFFRCVAIVLGVAPLYEKEYRQYAVGNTLPYLYARNFLHGFVQSLDVLDIHRRDNAGVSGAFGHAGGCAEVSCTNGQGDGCNIRCTQQNPQ